ncbi:4959_t:CDS:2, partial [Gigaspora rosea]
VIVNYYATTSFHIDANDDRLCVVVPVDQICYVRLDDVHSCIGTLYHTVFKHFHGHGEAIIDESSWSQNELLSLGVIFEHF